MKKSFVCVCTGNKYGTVYVDKLYNMASRHANNFKFFVITDSKKDWRSEINQIVVQPVFPTWWNKIHMFRNDIGLEGQVLFMDLDVVIFNSIDHLWEYGNDEFVIIQDFNRCRIKDYRVRNSSVMKFQAGKEVKVWEEFKSDPQRIMKKFRGDQDYMTARYPNAKLWPHNWVMSYKWEIGLEPGEKRNSPNDKFVQERITREKIITIRNGQKIESERIKKFNLPSDCSVAVFHGKPNPAEITKDPLVIDNWR
jgi:hypothetical protein